MSYFLIHSHKWECQGDADRRYPAHKLWRRPSATANAGAVAAATGLVASGLFKGQPPAFLNAVVALAQAADGVT
jgi:hypothetical protein